MKTVINDEYNFNIRPIRAGGVGLFLNHPTYTEERLLVVCHTVSECRDWIFRNFVGEKGTHFHIVVEMSDLDEIVEKL